MRIVVDYDQCESHAICMSILPQVFEVRDDDFMYVLDETPPEHLRADVEAAVRACPKQALKVVD
jgi:ferredoxin